MLENGEWKGLERRAAERVVDHSILLVSGKDSTELPFSETTRIYNASPEGVAFFLKTPVNVNGLLDLRICPQEGEDEIPFSCFLVQARVLRVSGMHGGARMQLVAAKFEEDATSLGWCRSIEAMARRIESAIAQDEESRTLNS